MTKLELESVLEDALTENDDLKSQNQKLKTELFQNQLANMMLRGQVKAMENIFSMSINREKTEEE